MPLLFLCCSHIESLFLLCHSFWIFTSLSDRFMFLLKRCFSSYELSLSLSLSRSLSLSLWLSLSLTLCLSLSVSLSLCLSLSLSDSLSLTLSLWLSLFLCLTLSLSDSLSLSLSPLSVSLSQTLMWSNNLRARLAPPFKPCASLCHGLAEWSHYPSPLRDSVNTKEYQDLFVYMFTPDRRIMCLPADQKTSLPFLWSETLRYDLH